LAKTQVLPPGNGADGSGDGQNWQGERENAGTGGGAPVSRRVTATGDTLLIQSAAPLVPTSDADDDRDVYRWTATGGWDCLSCQAPGDESRGDSNLGSFPYNHGPEFTLQRASYEQTITMTDDGDRVWFNSFDALVDEDINGIEDVYEWRDGALRLISTGKGDDPATFIGASRSGSDVFFSTLARLVGWDTDRASDIYDARVGGGFPEPPAEGVPCQDDVCQGPGARALADEPKTSPGSLDGNAVSARQSLVLRKPSTAQRRRAVAAGVLSLRFIATAPGRVTAVARTRVNRRARTVGRGSVRVDEAGAGTLTLRLGFSVNRLLARGRALRLTVRLTAPGARSRSITVPLMRSKRT
jgi:hypothetical protein